MRKIALTFCSLFGKDVTLERVLALDFATSSDGESLLCTGSGKIKRKHAFKSHILTKKATKRKRNLTHAGLVHDADLSNVKLQLCMK